MKKFITIFALAFLAIVLVGCKKKDNYIRLSYADWGDREFNRKMLDAFEAKNPGIKVELRDDILGSGFEFTGNLISSAQAGMLPDVFATDNVPTIVNAGLTLDVASYWDADEDAALVYENIALAGVYNGKRYGLPSAQFIKGIMINKTIFEASGLRTVPGKYRIDSRGYPVKDWTFSEFIEIAKAVKSITGNPATDTYGLDTWFGAADFQQIWPMMNDGTLQYDTWDGEKFSYNSPLWIEAMQQKVALEQLDDGTTLKLPIDLLLDYPHLNNVYISSGYVAMDIEGSWQFPQINVAAEKGIDLGFWPYPSGSDGLFPPTILDFQGVSSQTAHPEEAYLLAKWMTYGRDGWDTRLSILEEENRVKASQGQLPSYLIGFPVANYEELQSRINNLVAGIDGLQYSLDRMEYSKPDLDKWLAGYKDFWQWVGDDENSYSYTKLLEQGVDAVSTFAVEWEKKINEIVQEQMDAIQ